MALSAYARSFHPIKSGTCTMSAWAYRCHPCVEEESDWFVSQLDVEQLGPDVRIVRVRVGRDWKCAFLDRTQPVVVDSQLLRDVIPRPSRRNASVVRLMVFQEIGGEGDVHGA